MARRTGSGTRISFRCSPPNGSMRTSGSICSPPQARATTSRSPSIMTAIRCTVANCRTGTPSKPVRIATCWGSCVTPRAPTACILPRRTIAPSTGGSWAMARTSTPISRSSCRRAISIGRPCPNRTNSTFTALPRRPPNIWRTGCCASARSSTITSRNCCISIGGCNTNRSNPT